MNAALVDIDAELLGKLLNLPPGQHITRFSYNIATDAITVRIEGDGLPPCPHGCSAMAIRPHLRERKVTDLDWSDGSKKNG